MRKRLEKIIMDNARHPENPDGLKIELYTRDITNILDQMEADIKRVMRGVIGDKRKHSYYHQNHWKADVYNEAIDEANERLEAL